MIKLKLGPGSRSASTDGQQPAQNAASSSPATGSAMPVKLKLKTSQPPTPIEPSGQLSFPAASEQPATEKKKRPYVRKQDSSAKGKKRAADDDNSPAAKRIASGPGLSRKLSIKPPAPKGSEDGPKTRISLVKRKSSVPKIVDLRARGKAPPRPKGVGYDSEDSDTEKDPALQQGLVLRMEDGEDAQYLKEAIAKGQIGPHPSTGDAEVSLKFIEKNYRRAIVRIRGRMYAAALVEMPCIIESMKSFDKKGWWKVADINQMLLVLGRCNTEEEAKTYPLPRDVNKDNFQYAHGLTPPMHWVRKRRFRKRMNYNEIANVEEEVEKLLKADAEWEEAGGTVKAVTNAEQERASEAQAYEEEYDEDAEGEAVETVETDGQDYEEAPESEAQDEDDLEAKMQAMFDADGDEEQHVSELVTESPAPIADQAASMAAVENSMQEDFTPVGTPADGAGMTPQEPTSDEDEESDEDEDSPDVVDEDAAAKAAERAQQLEEVADLEREVERARQKVQAMTNQLLRQREAKKLDELMEDLRMKKQVFGLIDPED